MTSWHQCGMIIFIYVQFAQADDYWHHHQPLQFVSSSIRPSEETQEEDRTASQAAEWVFLSWELPQRPLIPLL